MPTSHKKRGKKRSLYNPSYPTSKRQKFKGVKLMNCNSRKIIYSTKHNRSTKNSRIRRMDTIHEENINIDEHMHNMKIK